MSKIPYVLFPHNGQYFTFEGFVKQLEIEIEAAKSYDTGTAKVVDRKLKNQILREIAEHFKDKSA